MNIVEIHIDRYKHPTLKLDTTVRIIRHGFCACLTELYRYSSIDVVMFLRGDNVNED